MHRVPSRDLQLQAPVGGGSPGHAHPPESRRQPWQRGNHQRHPGTGRQDGKITAPLDPDRQLQRPAGHEAWYTLALESLVLIGRLMDAPGESRDDECLKDMKKATADSMPKVLDQLPACFSTSLMV